jgi:hypothetical protein
MELTETAAAPSHERRGRALERRIPGWASGLLARLAQHRPDVVVREDLATYLIEVKSSRNVDRTVEELSRLGWLAPLHVKGAWAYLPPGEAEITDPYIDLRGWKARDPSAVFALAGEAAAWHLGYLDRAFDGSVAVWIPREARPPFGLRPHISAITLGWHASDAERIGPTTRLLSKRRLDLTRWAAGLPAFGPEALIVQLSARPASFRAWTDLVAHLSDLAADVDVQRLKDLLGERSSSAWQRAAYLLHAGQRTEDAQDVLAGRPHGAMPKVQLGNRNDAVWIPEFHIVDRIVAPLQGVADKA